MENEIVTLEDLEEAIISFQEEFIATIPKEPATDLEKDLKKLFEKFLAGMVRAAEKEKARAAGTSEKPDLERRRWMFIRHLAVYLAKGGPKQYMLSMLGDQDANEMIRLHGLAQIPRDADAIAVEKLLTEFLS